MLTKKTIQINPELFNIHGNKTKKNREKKEITINPVVNPSNLKNKLLKRIKEHKTRELKESSNLTPETAYTDEFYGAIDYLSGLKKKQKQQQILNNKTLKNHTITNEMPLNPHISLDLPPELSGVFKQPTITNDILTMNYKTNDDIPYGCLKNGKKKTYREWKEITEPSIYPELTDIIRPPTPPKKTDGVFFTSLNDSKIQEQNAINQNEKMISRENRLEQIKNKLRKLEDQEISTKRQAIENFNNMEKELVKPMGSKMLTELQNLDDDTIYPDIDELLKTREEKIEKQNPKQYLKKTVKRKFTLGKSDKLRRIAVLIKDRQTRKKIINAQKELKKTDITDVRKYLRQHGIIKVGSMCPPDILRTTFESAVLTGEVTNTNKETLLYNFMNEG